MGSVSIILWTAAGNGPFDGQFKSWAPLRVCRNMRDRILAILDHFSQWDSDATPYPTPLQTLAKRLHNERTDSQIEIAQRRHVEQMQEQILQSANDEREGTLGLLPRAP